MITAYRWLPMPNPAQPPIRASRPWWRAVAGLGVGLLLPHAPALRAQPLLPAPPETADATELARLTREGSGAELRRRYLLEAHRVLQRYWQHQANAKGKTLTTPKLLFAGERASGCGVQEVQHPMAFYCPPSNEIAMGMDLRRSARSAKGKSEAQILPMDLAVLAHEWGHHVNRSLGRGPYRGGLNLTVKQEELAADWRTGEFLGWMLAKGWLGLEAFSQAANLMFEIGDYELITPGHHGYPKERFIALTEGLATQVQPGERLGDWRMDTRESFSRPLPDAEPGGGVLRFEVKRFEIERSGQIATNLFGAALGAASCIWGNRDQCLGMALQQGKGRAYGQYTTRTLRLDCRNGSFDVSDDPFNAQPLQRDGKGQAAVLAQRHCAQ